MVINTQPTRIRKRQRRLWEYGFAENELDKELANIDAYGASIETKGNDTIRIGVQNVNGLKLETPRVGIEEIDVMKTCGLDVFGMCETNRSWKREARETLSTLARTEFGHAPTTASSCPSQRTGYLPGGTAMIARGRVAGRVWKRIPDELGRFTAMACHGRDQTGIILITIYRVCQTSGKGLSPNTAYMQQYVELRKKGVTFPNPRAQMLKDLSTLIEEWTERGYHPIVMGDFNGTLDDKDLQTFLQTHGLHDLVGEPN